MAVIGGNWTNHPTRPDVERSIYKKAEMLGLTKELPKLSILNWNELRTLDTRLWGLLKEGE